jgi:hypothetical protein
MDYIFFPQLYRAPTLLRRLIEGAAQPLSFSMNGATKSYPLREAVKRFFHCSIFRARSLDPMGS